MTRRANRLFFLAGAVAVLLTIFAAEVHRRTGNDVAAHLVIACMFAAFVFVVVLGIAPWAGTLALRHPTQNTQGYRDDYAVELEKETGPYYSQGWRRKRERQGLRMLKALGLYIEPNEKT